MHNFRQKLGTFFPTYILCNLDLSVLLSSLSILLKHPNLGGCDLDWIDPRMFDDTRSAGWACPSVEPAWDTRSWQREKRRGATRVGAENGSDTRVFFCVDISGSKRGV